MIAVSFVLSVSAIVLGGCGVDWVWSTSPNSNRDIAGSIVIVDSLTMPIPGDQSGIQVLLLHYGYPWNVVDSALTDSHGAWIMPDAPTGDFELVAYKTGYSVYLQGLNLTGSYKTSVSGEIATPMEHTVILDSFGFYRDPIDSSIAVYGHDSSASEGEILVCFDTLPNISPNGRHFASQINEISGTGARYNEGAFISEIFFTGPGSSALPDTLYVSAYSINPIEAEDRPGPWPPQYAGYRTCGPQSNIITIVHK